MRPRAQWRHRNRPLQCPATRQKRNCQCEQRRANGGRHRAPWRDDQIGDVIDVVDNANDQLIVVNCCVGFYVNLSGNFCFVDSNYLKNCEIFVSSVSKCQWQGVFVYLN
jgi:hypothetical protein